MKTTAKIWVSLKDIGAQVFSDLIRIHPNGNYQDRIFECELPADDPVIAQLMERLSQAGFRPWEDQSRPPDHTHEYDLRLERLYRPSDFAQCRLLRLESFDAAWNRGDSERHDPKGEAVLIVREHFMPKRKYDICRGVNSSFFVPTRIKILLESTGLAGVRFRPIRYIPLDWTPSDTDETIRQRHGTPYWELDSDREMPPLSPSLTLLNSKNQIVPRGSTGTCYPIEGLYNGPELHYREEDLARLEPFDLARTFEVFSGWGAPGDRPLIASKRFYEFWKKNDIKANWVPVRIDPA